MTTSSPRTRAHPERGLPVMDAPPAGIVETHISALFLLGDRVYKMKKAVRTGFLDFSQRESRLQACRQEVEVNRRFAPDVYLGVADVIGPDGKACDHLVVMKRMPDDRRLANLVLDGKATTEDIESLARRIVEIHRRSPRSARISDDASREAILRRWLRNIEEMLPSVGHHLDSDQLHLVGMLAERYLAGRGPLFEERIALGRIVDAHGDLKADDIYLLEDGPRILDAIEFDEHLRHIDVLDDLALLALDLERLGAPDLSGRLLGAAFKASGDAPPQSLIHHYIAYRALVRAKVACLRADQGSAEAGVQARLLLRIALEHLRASRVMLVMIGGLPGSGKSTLSSALAEARNYEVVSSDVVRKEIAGLPPEAPAGAAYREGIYAMEHTRRTYAEMSVRARGHLERGRSVVMDASWTDARLRFAAREMAEATSSDLVELHASVPSGVALDRIEARRRSTSDATAEIVMAMARNEDAWPSATQIDTQGSIDDALEKMLSCIADVTTDGYRLT